MMRLTADDLLEMQDRIGYECRVVISPHREGLIIEACFTDSSGEKHFSQRLFGFHEMERIEYHSRLIDFFCDEAKAFFDRASWEKRYIGVPRSMP